MRFAVKWVTLLLHAGIILAIGGEFLLIFFNLFIKFPLLLIRWGWIKEEDLVFPGGIRICSLIKANLFRDPISGVDNKGILIKDKIEIMMLIMLHALIVVLRAIVRDHLVSFGANIEMRGVSLL